MRLKILLAAMLSFALFGCNGDGRRDVGVIEDNLPPSATVNFSRTVLPFNGGSVEITVNVSDPSGVKFAEVNISPTPIGFAPVQLVPENRTVKTATKTLVVLLPLNSSRTDVTYQVTVRARDELNNEGTINIGTLTVRSVYSDFPSITPLPDPSGTF